ncbi:MAG: SpoIID/LytB domain-containing protein, partial [Candidatus Doudnabacteria bacterium]|nr:SpoIID/LytB domain-containing protein [Candidatus Doudnabacteria bacterium]
DVESYLKSILKENVSDLLPPTALDALAIVARTDAYYTALFNAGAYWHVKAKDVGYDGFGLILQQLEIDRSVDDTRHLVLTYEKQPFPSSWTTHCGGKTASYQTVFRKNTPTPSGVQSPFASTAREESHWTTILDAQFLASLAKMNRITRVELFQDPLSNKVYALRLYDGVHKEDLDFLAFQEKLEEKKLKSNEFTVSVKGDLIQFDGVGEGHGVGLCLYSAIQMAKRGDLAPKILSAFYPTTQLEKMRSYPQTIISSEEGLFVSPSQYKKLRKVLH